MTPNWSQPPDPLTREWQALTLELLMAIVVKLPPSPPPENESLLDDYIDLAKRLRKDQKR